MPRPKAINPRERIHLYLRPETIAKLRLLFASEDTMSGIIKGAMSTFVEVAIEERIARIQKEVNANVLHLPGEPVHNNG